MTGILLILLILFFLGLPFYWIYKLISKKKKGNKTNVQNLSKDESKFEASDLIRKTKFMFMDDYRMWTKLSEAERKERLNDIQVIFDYGKDHITREMIKKGFEPGSKIIDIKYFTGLSEHGFTISTFIIQHKDGGEIRALTMNIDLKKMEFKATRNAYFSSGKEKYYYLKDRENLMEI
ncbi:MULTISPECIES: hypothetical protein [Flavobacteriaceae]|uniref:Uncharacterized protein n=1 Tax=Winogradskyella luteola TaxID=2828330 RepID=A0A9X1JNN0_9FLAO|nr:MULTISPECIES: hypothetical protein [Flavobacteriaceae]MBV7269576.1 hypothetical protein [Winogradskyella luteola]